MRIGSVDSVTSEILALISDLDLVPINYWASDFFQIYELEIERRKRIECDLRALQKRNHSRLRKNVPASKSYCLQRTFEPELF